MVAASSLQLSNQLGTGSVYSHAKQAKVVHLFLIQTSNLTNSYISYKCILSQCVTGKGQLSFISSNELMKDAWSLYIPTKIGERRSSPSIKRKGFICRAVLVPNGGIDFSIIKIVAINLNRAFSNVSGSPVVVKLGSAIVIISFAAWGLRPLIRLSMKTFLHKNDSSWDKSSTDYITTSYIQPLLIWIGTMLICRALDPMILPTEASRVVKQRLLNFIRSLSTVMALGYCLSSLIQQLQKFFRDTNDSNDARKMGFDFASKAVYSAVWVGAVSLFMELLGFSTQKWLTAGGLGTVLLTLAGREIFTNFLSSVIIHTTRPFVLNEWIQTKIEGYEVSGTVEHIGWWSPTVIRGDDREAVHIPNHKFTVSVVRNLTQKSHWRIKTHFAISHLDVNKINNIVADMRKVLAKNPQVEQQRLHRRIFLDNVDQESQALRILVSCFVKTSHFEEYLCVKEAVLLDLLRVIRHHGARLATPIRTIQRVYTGAEPDTTRPEDHTHRPLLLIDSSYKISNVNKPKAPAKSTPSSEEKDDVEPNVTAVKDTEDEVVTSRPPPNATPSPLSQEPRVSQGMKKQDGGDMTTDNPSSTVASSTPTRPVMEENIVLGVALEGSKRTLPIEGMTPGEQKESIVLSGPFIKVKSSCLNYYKIKIKALCLSHFTTGYQHNESLITTYQESSRDMKGYYNTTLKMEKLKQREFKIIDLAGQRLTMLTMGFNNGNADTYGQQKRQGGGRDGRGGQGGHGGCGGRGGRGREGHGVNGKGHYKYHDYHNFKGNGK
ncbi:uncharacterized protein [Phyllobates terribilis]|uniref:uncharacterized protein n=1 Tax=Phyllobates terribilis TaxID=111132 RepID=UPI003CCADBA9